VTALSPPARRLKDAPLLIGDRWVAAASGGSREHLYPATGLPQAQIALGGSEEIDAAVAAARSALPAWRALGGDERRKQLLRLEAVLEEHAVELAEIQTLESGIPIAWTAGTPALAASWFGYFAGWADKLEGAMIPTFPQRGLDYTILEPYGVVGLITPWNAPLTILAFKLPAALAAGNTVVVKPSELAPFSTIRFAELALEAGLPPGVLNVVAGGPEAGDRLVRHPDVRKVSFTGGISTARKIIEASAETVTPLTLELGGKAANLLFADADLDQFVPAAAIMGMLAMSGQGCGCPTRLMVQDEIYDETLERLLAFAREATNAGDLLDPATTFGPLITEASCDRVLQIVDEARREGTGELLTGGGRMGGAHAGGFYVEPTVFTEVPAESPIAQMEIFGPVLSVMRFSTDEEAIELANSTTYGLGHFVNTRDLNRAHTLAAALEAGTVWVNGFSGAPPGTPLGGYRQSGFGREGGRAGLDEFLQVKNVYIAGIG